MSALALAGWYVVGGLAFEDLGGFKLFFTM
jgi:hypothetical protein